MKGEKNFLSAPPGAPGVELGSLMLNAASKNKLSLKQIIELMCINPAKDLIFILKKGLLKDSDADLVILDLKKSGLLKQKN